MFFRGVYTLLILLFIFPFISSKKRQEKTPSGRARRSLVEGASARPYRPVSNNTQAQSYVPDHPEWMYLNAIPWFKIDPTQQDHARFHAYLSMSAYGDYRALCPTTFTQGFIVVQEFNTTLGQSGFTAIVPEMKKVVIVFRGHGDYHTMDWSPDSIEDLVGACPGCKAARGIKSLYLSAKIATNDWEVAKKTVTQTGLLFSVTGHGLGGAVAALAAMDLGARGLVHYSHNQGMPRAFNYASTVRYDNLFQALAGQSLVCENDFAVQSIPAGPLYHVGTKVQIHGPLQQWLINCYGNNENVTCIGDGSSRENHYHYFAPLGSCGSASKGF